MTKRLALGFAVLLWAASARADSLFGPGEAKPEPAKPLPASPEPPKPDPAQARPEPGAGSPLPIPSSHRMSKPSPSGEVRTAMGSRIVKAKELSNKEVWFTVKRWVSKEKGWVPVEFAIKEGSGIGGSKRVGATVVDFSTSWMLLDVRKENRTFEGKVHRKPVFDDKGQQVVDASGQPVFKEERSPPETRKVPVAILQHVRARAQDGSPLQCKIDLGASIPVDLPEFSEDELPPLPPAPPGP